MIKPRTGLIWLMPPVVRLEGDPLRYRPNQTMTQCRRQSIGHAFVATSNKGDSRRKILEPQQFQLVPACASRNLVFTGLLHTAFDELTSVVVPGRTSSAR